MIKRFIYWGVVVWLLSCNSSRVINGTYKSTIDLYSFVHSIELVENSTFIYNITGGLINQTSEGIWVYNDSVLILKSNPDLKPGVIDIIEKIDFSSDSFNIKVIDENGNPLSFAAISINGNTEYGFDLDENGIGKHESFELKSLTTHYLASNYNCKLKDPKSNNIELKIRLESEDSFHFENEIFKVKNRKLIGKNDFKLKKINSANQ